jgi:hypothetical protein
MPYFVHTVLKESSEIPALGMCDTDHNRRATEEVATNPVAVLRQLILIPEFEDIHAVMSLISLFFSAIILILFFVIILPFVIFAKTTVGAESLCHCCRKLRHF